MFQFRTLRPSAHPSTARLILTKSLQARILLRDRTLFSVTGEILILNGASAGTAGWELAQKPVLNPVLYRPDRPFGYRFEVMKPSTTPRMYHSAAILDSFGRVLVGGSNPHVGYVFQNVTYPTDLSLEAYLPPYLDTAHDPMRPRRVQVGPPAEIGYGDVALVRFAYVVKLNLPP